MPRINLYAKFGTPIPAVPTSSRIGTPILTQTYPAFPPGSQPGDILFKNPVPAIPLGSKPGTALDIMTQTAAEEFGKILQNIRKK
jgi:hypothetical protein